MFNLRDDPGEQNDLSQKQPEKTGELLAMLHQWRDDVSAAEMSVK